MVDYQRLNKKIGAELELNPNMTDVALYKFVCTELQSVKDTDDFFKAYGYHYLKIKSIKNQIKKRKQRYQALLS